MHALLGYRGQRFLTEEVEFCRQRQSVPVGDEGVVSSVLWLHVVDKQFMEPDRSHVPQCQNEL